MSKRDKKNYEDSGNGQDMEEMAEYKKPGKKEPKSALKKRDKRRTASRGT